MTPLAEQTVGALAALALLLVVGFGPCLVLLPNGLRAHFWLAVPPVGLAIAAVALGWLGIVLPGAQAAWVLVGAGLALDVVLLARRLRPPAGPRLDPALVLLLAAGGFGVALLPLWNRPDLLAIGPNWDVEIYLPLAEYLKQHPTGFALDQPAGIPFAGLPNPLLWRVNFFDTRWAGLGFSQVHAAAGVLTGQAAHQHFSGLLALMFALAVPAGFLLLRAAFRLERAPALAGALLLAISPPLLHVVFWSFGQQAAALPLLPLAASTAVVALRDPSLRASTLAGLCLAGLLAVYIPGAAPYFALAPLLVLVVARQRGGLAVAGAVIGTVAVSFALAPWAYARGLLRISHLIGDGGVSGMTTGPDVASFAPLGWAFGLFALPSGGLGGVLTAGDPVEGVATAAARLSILALGGFGLIMARRRGLTELAVAAVGALVLLLVVRYGAGYPYGHLKLFPAAAPLLLGPLLLGLWESWRACPRSGRGWLGTRAAVVLAAGLFLGVNVVSAAGLVVRMRADSTLAYRSLEGVGAAVPPGASVQLTHHHDLQGPRAGALLYFLRHAEVYGYVVTGYSSFFRERDDGVYQYAVFQDGDAPQPEVYPNAARVWSGGGVRLLHGPGGVAHARDLGRQGAPPVIERTGGHGATAGLTLDRWTAEGYPEFAGWSPPLAGTLSVSRGPEIRYPGVERGHEFEFPVPLPAGPTVLPDRRAKRDLLVTIASLRGQDVTITVNGRTERLTLRAGLSSYPLRAVLLPGTVRVRNENLQPVFVKALQVLEPDGLALRTVEHAEAVLVRWNVRQREDGLQLAVDYLGPRHAPVVDIYSEDGSQHFGYWKLPAPGPGQMRAYRMRLDTMRQELTVLRQTAETRIEGWRGEAPDGVYRAYLVLYEGPAAVRQVPLCAFSLKAHRVEAVTEDPTGLYIG